MSIGGDQRAATAPAAAPWPRVTRGLALGALGVVVATGIKLAFQDAIGAATPFLLYPVIVVAAAWFGGWPAGLATTLGAAFAADTLFTSDVGVLRRLTQSAAFVLECGLLTWLTVALQRAGVRAREAARTAQGALARLEVVMRGVDEGITVQDASGKLVYANRLAAELAGFATAEAMLAAPAGEIVRRFEMLDPEGQPLTAERLPARVLFSGGTPREQLVRFRRRDGGDERWSVLRASPVRDATGALIFAINLFRDVTELRKHDQALQVSEQWLGTTLRSIGDAVIAVSPDARIVFLNPAAEQITGWSSAEATGRPLGEAFPIFSEATGEAVEAPVERVLRDGQVVGLANHTILRRRDGRELAIDDSAAPIRDAQGAVAGVVLVFRDVSAERRADQRRRFLTRATELLAGSLDYDRTLATLAEAAVPEFADWCGVDLAVDGRPHRLAVAHVDPARRALVFEIERRYPPEPDAPRGTARILQTGRSEWIREIDRALLVAAARDAEHLALIDQLELGSYIGVPIRRGDTVIGAITFAMAESRRHYEAQDLATAEALADRAGVAIEHARLYREAEVLRSEAAAQRDRLQAMVMAAPTAICVLRGPELEFELMNEPYRARLNPRVRPGARVTEVALDDTNVAMLQRVFATGEPASAIEAPVTADYAAGRQTHYVSYVVQPLRDASGRVDRVVLFANDVTDQVVARRQLEDAHRRAQDANQAKDEFLAILGHELRNPLAPIVTALELMELRGAEVFDRTRATIHRQVRHMTRLVDDLLDVSRITRGKVELRREPVAIADVVARAVEQIEPALAGGGQQLAVAIEPGLTAQGDPVRLAQVVANLLGNAIKYTPRTGRIAIDGRRDGDHVVIVVRDTGIGITADMLPRVFELFAQERKALDRAGGGLGLGLAIVRGLVERHGGTVVARSDGVGRGAELEVRLPAARADIEDELAWGAPTPPPATRARVLLVDDNVDALELLAFALETSGHAVFRAEDGPAALALAREVAPTVAVLDIGLPGMDGYELARRLRDDCAAIKLIAVTGYGQDADRRRALAVGFDEHLVKPVSVEIVAAAIDRLQRA